MMRKLFGESKMWIIKYEKTAIKQQKIIAHSNYRDKVIELIRIIQNNPFQNPPPYEKLQPPRNNKYSRRISKQHRLVYEVIEEENFIKILSMWTHYEAY